MHTAHQLKQELFQIEIDGSPARREELLPEWGPLSRFGILMHEPFGVIGASYLIQLAVTAFYDIRPARRSRERPTYPEIYAFHVGGRFGELASFDFFPPRKEVFVENAPMPLLDAINDRGITHLAVPDRKPEPVQHVFKEPAQALDRIVAVWAYTAAGTTAGADVALSSQERLAEANTKMALHPSQSYAERLQAKQAIGATKVPEDELMVFPESRQDEVDEATRDMVRDRRLSLQGERGLTETYRRIEVTEALQMLHRGPAPAFRPSQSG